MTYERSSFHAFCYPRSDGSASLARPEEPLARRPRGLKLWLETKGWIVEIEHTASARVGTDEATGLQVLLHGEVLGLGVDPAKEVAEQFARRGHAAARALRGSFAVLVVDPVHDQVAVVTDRVNSRRVYGSLDGDGARLSTALADHMVGDVDPVGTAWYLSNGDVHASRTIMDRVTVLARASWNLVTRNGIVPTSYWQFTPGAGSDHTDEERLSRELSGLLVAAVRRNIADEPHLFVSLSGGYDATAIVGALRSEAAVPDVRCFTYALGPAGRDTDERRAAATAALAGFPYHRVQSYDGDLVRAIERNAAMGQGSKGFVHEADAWRTLGNELEALPNPVVLAGDECFGGALDHTIRTREEAARSVGLRDFGVLRPLAPLLDPGLRERMAAGMAADMKAILARCPPSGDPRDCRDFLYLDQRLANVISPWREAFAFRYATLRNPLLDNDILDFVSKLPGSLRRTKVLFRRTVAHMYPELFAMPRAKRSNYMIDLGREIARQRQGLLRLATTGRSKLDELIPPAITVALIDAAAASAGRPPSLQVRAKDLARAALPPGASNVVRRHRPPALHPPVDTPTLAVRLLILRTTLAEEQTSRAGE